MRRGLPQPLLRLVHAGRPAEGAATLAGELDKLHAALGKPLVLTEFGADTIAGHHSIPPEMFSEEYQVEFLRGYLDGAAVRPFVAGLHIWNFADFKTARGVLRPGGLNHKGVFTRDRRPSWPPTSCASAGAGGDPAECAGRAGELRAARGAVEAHFLAEPSRRR